MSIQICAITNVYNEPFNLPIWLRYYGEQVGVENCLVVDHGTDDGSTAGLGGASRIRIPRSKRDERVRADFMTSLANSLLNHYDWVLYSDCDELLVADPRRFESLADMCARLEGPATTACGVNLFHNLDHEGPIRDGEPILVEQRSYVQFASSMCKTLAVREPVSWGGGFHSSNFEPSFDGLYLFHLRPVDIGESLKRLATTRTIEFADDPGYYTHHMARFSDHARRYLAYPTMPIRTDDFGFAEELDRVRAHVEYSHTNRYFLQDEHHFNSSVACVVPPEFKGVF